MGYFKSTENLFPSRPTYEAHSHYTSLIVMVIIALFLCLIPSLRSYIKQSLSLPPGPIALPILGNIPQTLASTEPIWEIFQKWHKQYGPIISVRYGTRTVVSLGSYGAAKDLVQRRAEKYASRPWSIVGHYFTGGLHTALVPWGPRWKAHHLFHTRVLNANISQRYEPLIDLESTQVLHELLESGGEKFPQIFSRYAYSLGWTLAFGRRLENHADKRLGDIIHLTDEINKSFQRPLFLLVEIMPFLNWLPYPLAPWKRLGGRHFERCETLFGESTEHGIRMNSWNWAKDFRKQNRDYGFSETEASFVLGSLVDASINTSFMMEFFVLAAVLHPNAVKRAQAELDTVIGINRLPTLQDEACLPFVRAFIREVQRWRPITPLSVPHSTTADDEYNGYKIPKGTTILINEWAMNHDPQLFEDPDTFAPERWLNAGSSLPAPSNFGYGKRTCPGQNIGRRSLFINLSRMLWAFNIGLQPGSNEPVKTYNLSSGLTAGPAPFEASFEIRSPAHRKIIQDAWSSKPKDVGEILDSIAELQFA